MILVRRTAVSKWEAVAACVSRGIITCGAVIPAVFAVMCLHMSSTFSVVCGNAGILEMACVAASIEAAVVVASLGGRTLNGSDCCSKASRESEMPLSAASANQLKRYQISPKMRESYIHSILD
jgi:hypothetical protein